MTAKQAIKARCRDCSGPSCAFTDCALLGLANKQGRVNRKEAIRKYYHWCMNGNPVNQCASPDCAIYQYRTECEGSLKVSFLAVNYPQKITIEGNGGPSKSKTIESYGKAEGASQITRNGSFPAPGKEARP
jgi:hypothetical protein